MSLLSRAQNQALETVEKILDIGEEHQLGGDGEPVGVVVVYKNAAFINGSWAGTPEHRMEALVDAAAAEGLKKK